MPPVEHRGFGVHDSGPRAVQACRACTARGGPPAGHPAVPTGVVRRDEAKDEAPTFAPDWFAQESYRYSSILCGYPWPPPMGSRYRFDMPVPGLYCVTLEYPVLPPVFWSPDPILPCTGATDDDTADHEYWDALPLSAV